jgi:hypothetical protein
MAANRPLRVIRPATIAFSPNIVRPWLAARFRTASVDPPTPLGEKMLTAQAPVGHARYPAPGAGSGKSGAVTSRALYVSPDPAPSPPPQIWHGSHPLSPLLKGGHVSPPRRRARSGRLVSDAAAFFSQRRALQYAAVALGGRRELRTLAECEEGKQTAVREFAAFLDADTVPKSSKMKALHAGKCIATDDPRLKEK